MVIAVPLKLVADRIVMVRLVPVPVNVTLLTGMVVGSDEAVALRITLVMAVSMSVTRKVILVARSSYMVKVSGSPVITGGSLIGVTVMVKLLVRERLTPPLLVPPSSWA